MRRRWGTVLVCCVRRFGTSIPRGREREKVLVLGSGWGGYRVAKDLDKARYDVTLISPRNHFLFTPLLCSTTVGTLEFRCASEPVRAIKGIRFHLASAKEIDIEKKEILCRAVYHSDQAHSTPQLEKKLSREQFVCKYDKCVIAVGAINQTFGTPGVTEHVHFLKELRDARKIRKRILMCFERSMEPSTTDEERKRLLHFVIVGGGPTGVEFAGELYDFLTSDIKRAFPEVTPFIKVSLVEASPSVLGSFNEALSTYAKKQLADHGVHLYTGISVKKVHGREIELSNGQVLRYGLCVWSTGTAPRKFVEEMNYPKEKGRLIVDDHLRVTDDVYAIGDCSFIKNRPLPGTAQVANQQAKYLVKLLNGKTHEAFKYNHFGSLAYTGGWKAISDLPQAKLSGFWSWVFWRSAYLTTTVSLINKVLIPMHWLKAWIFGRDLTSF
eukprot:TRINITY_DN619_c0_g1_i2.p1 TRINITY_DN619_c0_g1~~TRINITY_DN619_c0_g1_i2.p1  ORF type:complete len:440 (-),score=51.04 TRINITY_DN619_c0_g1_i2:459-1778(-)